MKTLTKAIMGKKAGSSFNTAIGGRLYKTIADEDAVYPYSVFKVVNDRPEYTFKNTFEDVIIQFSLFSASNSSSEVEDLFTYLKTVYDDCALTLTGSSLIWMVRQNANLILEEHTVKPSSGGESIIWVWAYHVDYNIVFERT